MKRFPVLFSLSIAAATLFATLGEATAQQAAAFRRFTTRDGKAFSAAVVKKDNASVTLKFSNGGVTVLPIRQLSEPDQQFVRKWTKFKDDLLNSAEFATLSVKDMLELRGYQSFEFDIEGNHIFVEGQLNGKDMKFMVDTGAQSSLVHLGSAQEAGLEIGPMDQTIYGIGGKVQAAVTKAPTIKLGDAVIENRRLLTTDIFKNIPSGKGYDAIFGADFLRELDAVISYREGRMFLKPDNVLLKSTTAPGAPVPEKPETAG
jgi:clan AA aspartic protease (TIGR02281 family)